MESGARVAAASAGIGPGEEAALTVARLGALSPSSSCAHSKAMQAPRRPACVQLRRRRSAETRLAWVSGPAGTCPDRSGPVWQRQRQQALALCEASSRRHELLDPLRLGDFVEGPLIVRINARAKGPSAGTTSLSLDRIAARFVFFGWLFFSHAFFSALLFETSSHIAVPVQAPNATAAKPIHGMRLTRGGCSEESARTSLSSAESPSTLAVPDSGATHQTVDKRQGADTGISLP